MVDIDVDGGASRCHRAGQFDLHEVRSTFSSLLVEFDLVALTVSLPQPDLQALCRSGPGKRIILKKIATQPAQQIGMRLGLDAFGHDTEPKELAHADNRVLDLIAEFPTLLIGLRNQPKNETFGVQR